MKLPLTGGCVCGNVRYECAEAPLSMFKCHCKTCQMISGGAYVPVVLLKSKAFKLTKGALKYHFTDNIGGHLHKRGFCGDCGSRLTGAESEKKRPWIAVTASSLDDPSIFKPAFHIFASHAQSWDVLEPGIPAYPEYMPR